jgi:hypothetical protein
MEYLRIRKRYLELEVSYLSGNVLIQPAAFNPEYAYSAQVIARSEELFSTQHLNSIASKSPCKDLEAYFVRKGWEVVP